MAEVPTLFTCPVCERTSHHPDDARYGYCGACHAFTRRLRAGQHPMGRGDRIAELQYVLGQLQAVPHGSGCASDDEPAGVCDCALARAVDVICGRIRNLQEAW